MAYAELLTEFKEWVTNDVTPQEYWLKVNSGTATYQDADKYSKIVGDKWFELVSKYYGEVNETELETLRQALEKDYSESAYYTKNVQKNLNKKGGIGMNALEPKVDDRIDNLMKLIEEYEGKLDGILTEETFETIAKSAVVDTAQANARIQSKAGLKNYLIRHTGANGCCKWCQSMAGTYAFGEQPSDFWRFHRDCDCWIEYKFNKTSSRVRMTTQNGAMTRVTS